MQYSERKRAMMNTSKKQNGTITEETTDEVTEELDGLVTPDITKGQRLEQAFQQDLAKKALQHPVLKPLPEQAPD
jgi:hypothetical protein